MDEIRKIGPVLPGSLDAYHTVCGKPGCRCKDKDNPKRHGPYYRLSYSLAGRNSSMFVKQQDVERVRTMVSNYKRLRQLTVELALTSLESVKALGVAATTAGSSANEGTWKDKCLHKSVQLKAAAVKIRDLGNSRDRWRGECLKLRKEVKALKAVVDRGSVRPREKK
jgi:hypothetical protein